MYVAGGNLRRTPLRGKSTISFLYKDLLMVMGELTQETDVLVIGSGPGGYSAAFRAADLGLDVTMVDTARRPGGECLFRGCIPSKTLLYLAELIHDVRRAREMGVAFGDPQVDLESLRAWKEKTASMGASLGLVKRYSNAATGRLELSAPPGVKGLQPVMDISSGILASRSVTVPKGKRAANAASVQRGRP